MTLELSRLGVLVFCDILTSLSDNVQFLEQVRSSKCNFFSSPLRDLNTPRLRRVLDWVSKKIIEQKLIKIPLLVYRPI